MKNLFCLYFDVQKKVKNVFKTIMLCFIFITSRARIDLDHDFFDILTFGTAPTFKFVFFQECETSSTLSVQLLHSCFYFLCVRSLLPYGMWNNQSNIQVRIFAFACSQRSQPRSLKEIDIQNFLLYFQLELDFTYLYLISNKLLIKIQYDNIYEYEIDQKH